jgi:uncharacterized membrane protein YfcA
LRRSPEDDAVQIGLIGLLAALTGAGLATGFLGGLFGIGGGAIVAPALFYLFGAIGVPDDVRAHAAVATSLSTIMATSVRSMSAHAKAGAVDFAVLKAWLPWMAIGAGLGGLAAGYAEAEALLIVFGGGMILTAALMGLASPTWRVASEMPQGLARAGIGAGVGALSAIMGIGGGAFGTTLMTLCGRPIHQAVATASGFGAAIALPGALAYVAAGWGQAGLPWGSLGFVNMPGFVVVAALTSLTAPLGARLAHRLDRTMLKRLFAVFLALMGASILWEALSG